MTLLTPNLRRATGPKEQWSLYTGLATFMLMFFTISFSQQARCAYEEPLLAPQSSSDPGSGRLKFDLYNNQIYIPVRVNGSEPLTFLLDTGATESFISDRRAHLLGLDVGRQVEGHFGTGEGEAKLAFAKGVKFELGGLAVNPKSVVVIPAGLSLVLGHNIDGIAGAEFFKSWVIEIDYTKGEISLHEPKTFSYKGNGAVLPLTFSDNRPFLQAVLTISGLGRIDGKYILDLGDNRALALNSPYVREHHILSSDRKTIKNEALGIGGGAPELLGRAESFQLGPFLLEQPIVAFSTAAKGSTSTSSYDGVIGTEILRRFRVTLDYYHHHLILEPTPAVSDPFEVDMTGMRLVGAGPDFKTISVARVEENSPASEAGILAGDKINAIDGQPIMRLTLDGVKEMFRQDGKEYALEIKRGDQILQLMLKTQRRI